jgi:hypothetical protein
MTDATDSAIGAVSGLLAVGIMANVASKMIGGQRGSRGPRGQRGARGKSSNLIVKKSKGNKKLW